MPAITLLKVVATRDTIVEDSLKFWLWDFRILTLVIFSLISAALLVWLIAGIVRIGILIRSNPNKSWNNINFIFTEAKGTPFSFFKYIFWNKNIDLQTDEGKYILQHELTHVSGKHSADKLFLHIVLVAGWLNPFFWLIRKELDMIHEFIADEKAISDGDIDTFSAMLLKTAYPQHSFPLANSFFHSPIKRRLIMFTNSKKPSYSYFRRLMILPLLCFVIVFFSFKTKGQNSNKIPNSSTNVSTIKFEKCCYYK
ncbi:MAG: M56 family metallopeptidase [Segetibacter sp.]